jgi:hypothetical protein
MGGAGGGPVERDHEPVVTEDIPGNHSLYCDIAFRVSRLAPAQASAGAPGPSAGGHRGPAPCLRSPSTYAVVG